MLATLKRLLLGEDQSEEIKAIEAEIHALEQKARKLAHERKEVRYENQVGQRLTWIFSRGHNE